MKSLHIIHNKDNTTLITFNDMQIKFATPFFDQIRREEFLGEMAWSYYAAHAQWREVRSTSSDIVVCPHCGENIAFMFNTSPLASYCVESNCLFCLQPIQVSARSILVANALYRTKPYEPQYEDV